MSERVRPRRQRGNRLIAILCGLLAVMTAACGANPAAAVPTALPAQPTAAPVSTTAVPAPPPTALASPMTAVAATSTVARVASPTNAPASPSAVPTSTEVVRTATATSQPPTATSAVRPAATAASTPAAGAPSPPYGAIRTAAGKQVYVRLELADTPETRSTGLMNRQRMDADAGMLFVFPSEGRASFWMRNTLLPLSIAFIATDGTIQEIQDMQPLSEELHTPARPYRFALEVNQGYFQTNGIAPGDRIEFRLGGRS